MLLLLRSATDSYRSHYHEDAIAGKFVVDNPLLAVAPSHCTRPPARSRLAVFFVRVEAALATQHEHNHCARWLEADTKGSWS